MTAPRSSRRPRARARQLRLEPSSRPQMGQQQHGTRLSRARGPLAQFAPDPRAAKSVARVLRLEAARLDASARRARQRTTAATTACKWHPGRSGTPPTRESPPRACAASRGCAEHPSARAPERPAERRGGRPTGACPGARQGRHSVPELASACRACLRTLLVCSSPALVQELARLVGATAAQAAVVTALLGVLDQVSRLRGERPRTLPTPGLWPPAADASWVQLLRLLQQQDATRAALRHVSSAAAAEASVPSYGAT